MGMGPAEVGTLFRLGGLQAKTSEGVWNMQYAPVVVESKTECVSREYGCRVWHLGYRLVFLDSEEQQLFVRTSGRDYLELSSDFVVSPAELDRAEAALTAYTAAASKTVPVCVTNNVDTIGGAKGTIIGIDQHGAHFLVRIPSTSDRNTADRVFMVLPQDVTVLANSEATG